MNKTVIASLCALLYAFIMLSLTYSLRKDALLTSFYGGLGVGLSSTIIKVFFSENLTEPIKAASNTLLNVALVVMLLGLALYGIPRVVH